MTFEIHISTKNRREDLALTLERIAPLRNDSVVCRIIDDGSTDGTFDYVKTHFPSILITRNEVSKGYIHCRNKMLNEAQSDYAVSLDDDAHFVSPDPLEKIVSHFALHPKCGVIAFRIFWGKGELPKEQVDDDETAVKSYVGCGHAWRVSAWRAIPDYPEWFQFYGEEQFASLQLFRQGFTVDYLPAVFVQHRVDMQARKKNTSDSNARFRNALRADWYNYLLFYPVSAIPRKMAYSLKNQFAKILKGQGRLFLPLLGAVADLLLHLPRIIRERRALSKKDYADYMKLPPAKIF